MKEFGPRWGRHWRPLDLRKHKTVMNTHPCIFHNTVRPASDKVPHDIPSSPGISLSNILLFHPEKITCTEMFKVLGKNSLDQRFRGKGVYMGHYVAVLTKGKKNP